jgi:hypothetical protein
MNIWFGCAVEGGDEGMRIRRGKGETTFGGEERPG